MLVYKGYIDTAFIVHASFATFASSCCFYYLFDKHSVNVHVHTVLSSGVQCGSFLTMPFKWGAVPLIMSMYTFSG